MQHAIGDWAMMTALRRIIPAYVLAAAASAATFLAAWVLLAPRDAGAGRGLLFTAVLLGAGCGLIGSLAAWVRSAVAPVALWAALGLLLAVALPTALSIGIIFLALAALLVPALATMPPQAGRAWWHPRHSLAGLLAFTVMFWAIFLLA